jgi:peptide/nickel transport system substrate-binding protein
VLEEGDGSGLRDRRTARLWRGEQVVEGVGGELMEVRRRASVTYKLSRRRFLKGAVTAAVLAATGGLTVSCRPKRQAATPAVEEAPRHGGSLTVRLRTDPPNLSFFTASFATATAINMCYSKLVRRRWGPDVPPDEVVLEPDLAETMPEMPDPVTIIFRLRPGVRWHNLPPTYGRTLTAQEVAMAIDAYRTHPRSAFRSDYAVIDSVQTPDERTVKLSLKAPHAPLLPISAGHYGLRIFPPELLDGDAHLKQVVGTGPFILESYQPGGRLVYRRNPDYFREGRPYLDSLTLAIITEEASAVAAFLAGQLDIVGDIPCHNAAEIRGARPEAKFVKILNALPGGYIAVNTARAPWNDVRVRRALSMAFNRRAEIEATQCGEGEPDQLIPIGGWRHALRPQQMGDAARYWEYNPQEARRLITEAGYSGGLEAVAVYTPAYGAPYQDTLARAISDFAAIGIRIRPVSIEYSQWISSVYRPPFNFEDILWGPSRFYNDPDPYVWYWLHPDRREGISNQSRVNDPEITQLLVQQRQELDFTRRKSLLDRIQLRVAEQQYYIGRTTGVAYLFWQPYVRDFAPLLGYEMPALEGTWDARV